MFIFSLPVAFMKINNNNNNNNKNGKTKEVVKDQIVHEQLKLLLKSKLSCRNLIMAINTWAIAVVRFGEGVIGWTKVELEEMGRNTRQLLIQHGGARRKLEKINNYWELRVEIARV